MFTPIRLPPETVRLAVYLRREDLPGPGREIACLGWVTWVRHLNRLVTRGRADDDEQAKAVRFSGEEPILYPGFYELLDGLRRDLPVEIETRLGFDLEEWLSRVSPDRFDATRLAPVLRVTFDPRTMEPEGTVERALALQGADFPIAVRALLVPTHKAHALALAEHGRRAGLDCRTAPFFGHLGGRLFGQYHDRAACMGPENVPHPPSGVNSRQPRAAYPVGAPPPPVLCRSHQVLVAPDGQMFGCRRLLATGKAPLSRLTAEEPRLDGAPQACTSFGRCHPRDVAVALDPMTTSRRSQDRGRFAAPLVEPMTTTRRSLIARRRAAS